MITKRLIRKLKMKDEVQEYKYKGNLKELLEKIQGDIPEFYRPVIEYVFLEGFQSGAVYAKLFETDSNEFSRKITCENDANRDKIVYDRKIIYIDDSRASVTKVDIERALNNSIAQIPGVEYIYMLQENKSFNVWTIINDMNIELMEKIYEKEIEIYNQLPNTLFDFHVLIRNNRHIDKMPLTGSEQVYNQELI